MDILKKLRSNLKNKEKFKYIFIGLLTIILFLIFVIVNEYKDKKLEYSISRLTNKYQSNMSTINETKDSKYEEDMLNRNNEYDTKINISSIQLEEDKKVESYMLNFFNLANNNDIDKLYSLFNKDYIEEFDVFKSVVTEKYCSANKGLKYEVKSKIKLNDKTILTVNITNLDDSTVSITDFTIFEDGTLADIQIESIQKIDSLLKKDDITYTVEKEYSSKFTDYYILNISNESEYLMDILDIQTKKNKNFHRTKIFGQSSNSIYPGIPEKIILDIPNDKGIDTVIITYKILSESKNEKTKEVVIDIDR